MIWWILGLVATGLLLWGLAASAQRRRARKRLIRRLEQLCGYQLANE